jgi:hypothetical protein
MMVEVRQEGSIVMTVYQTGFLLLGVVGWLEVWQEEYIVVEL